MSLPSAVMGRGAVFAPGAGRRREGAPEGTACSFILFTVQNK
jgi:hypothetical protein